MKSSRMAWLATLALALVASCSSRSLVLINVMGSTTFSDVRLSLTANKDEKTTFTHVNLNTTAPYELGMALDAAGRSDEAYAAFLETTRRGPTSDNAANATAHLTRLLFARGQNDAAIALLREGVKLYPQSSKLLGNLAIVLADSPDPAARAEGRELFETLVHRFPHYEHGLRSYEARYGPVR